MFVLFGLDVAREIGGLTDWGLAGRIADQLLCRWRGLGDKWYTCVHNGTQEEPMETLKVGIREFRDKLSTYVLESDAPVAITRHGDTVGYFLPARRKRTDADRAALEEAAAKWQGVMDAHGIDEEEFVAEFKRRRKQWTS